MELAARFSTQSVTHVTPLAAQIHGHKRDIDRRATITNTYVHRRYHANTHDPTPLHSSVTGSHITVSPDPSSLGRGGNARLAIAVVLVVHGSGLEIQKLIAGQY